MEEQLFEMECGRCGETRLEPLTESESRTVADGVGPVYRQCLRCERTTGWIASRVLAANGLSGQAAQSSIRTGQIDPRVPQGQERLASESELDEMNDLLQELRDGQLFQ
ncbi:MAG: hypothetical protein JNJ50_14045 [Acidobacteria bacterium]|nr:hypothetical protein [Acidobacteriota bacterium]